MISGFVKVGRQAFWAEIWPQIKSQVDAVQSNLEKFKLGVEDTLVIHWGYKDPDTEEVVVVAVSENVRGKMDEHWVTPSLLKS